MDLEGTYVTSGGGVELEIVTERDYDEYMRRYRERQRQRNVQEPPQREHAGIA